MANVKEACNKSGGTYEQQGKCTCPPGIRSSWDAGITLNFCTEIDTVGVAEIDRSAANERSFWDEVLSCESPFLTIGVVIGITVLSSIFICLCILAVLVSRKRRRRQLII